MKSMIGKGCNCEEWGGDISICSLGGTVQGGRYSGGTLRRSLQVTKEVC
jgi:hypothetical protein